jgi:hypothetical protein
MSREFSLERYREILLLAKEKGYWLPKVCEVGRPPLAERSFLLVRHDIDISVDAALEMAEIEHQLEVTTSYYVRLHCPLYNVMEQETLAKILAIQGMGHEMGLHYEAGFFEAMGRDPLQGITNDIDILEKLTGTRVQSISQHLPSLSRVYPELWEKYIDAYQPMLARDIPYFGDSGRHWREGCISHKIGKYPRFHTLIHPYAWTKWHERWEDNLRAHGEAAKAVIHENVDKILEMQTDYLARRDVLDREREERYKEM